MSNIKKLMINNISELNRIKTLASQNRKKNNKYTSIIIRQIFKIGRESKLNIKIQKEYVIYPYIIDIFIKNYGIAIELDGEEHKKKIEYDSRRDTLFENLGILVVHFDYENIEKFLSETEIILKNAILSRTATDFDFTKIRKNNDICSSIEKVPKYLSYDEVLRLEKIKLRKIRRKEKRLLNIKTG